VHKTVLAIAKAFIGCYEDGFSFPTKLIKKQSAIMAKNHRIGEDAVSESKVIVFEEFVEVLTSILQGVCRVEPLWFSTSRYNSPAVKISFGLRDALGKTTRESFLDVSHVYNPGYKSVKNRVVSEPVPERFIHFPKLSNVEFLGGLGIFLRQQGEDWILSVKNHEFKLLLRKEEMLINQRKGMWYVVDAVEIKAQGT